MKKLNLVMIMLMLSGTVFGDDHTLYAERLFLMEKQGHIAPGEAQDTVLALQVRDNSAIAKQARGVASAIAPKKVIKIQNIPIEVFVPKN